MARIRTIKPHIWQDEKIGRLTRDARLLYVGLITLADDEGRFRTLPSLVCGNLYPRDTDAPRKLAKWMRELSDPGLIFLYGDEYGCFPKWTSHQRVSHPAPSLLPAPSRNGHEPLANHHGRIPE